MGKVETNKKLLTRLEEVLDEVDKVRDEAEDEDYAHEANQPCSITHNLQIEVLFCAGCPGGDGVSLNVDGKSGEIYDIVYFDNRDLDYAEIEMFGNRKRRLIDWLEPYVMSYVECINQ